MRSNLRILAVVFLGAVSASVLYAEGPDKSAKEAIAAVGKRWDLAGQKRDTAALKEILADDFLSIESDGSTRNKTQFIESVTRSNLTYQPGVAESQEIRVYGTTGVYTGRIQINATLDGKKVTNTVRVLAVYVLNDGQWQVTAVSATPIR